MEICRQDALWQSYLSFWNAIIQDGPKSRNSRFTSRTSKTVSAEPKLCDFSPVIKVCKMGSWQMCSNSPVKHRIQLFSKYRTHTVLHNPPNNPPVWDSGSVSLITDCQQVGRGSTARQFRQLESWQPDFQDQLWCSRPQFCQYTACLIFPYKQSRNSRDHSSAGNLGGKPWEAAEERRYGGVQQLPVAFWRLFEKQYKIQRGQVLPLPDLTLEDDSTVASNLCAEKQSCSAPLRFWTKRLLHWVATQENWFQHQQSLDRRVRHFTSGHLSFYLFFPPPFIWIIHEFLS